MRSLLAALAALLALTPPVRAQQADLRRLAGIVSVAVDEYGKAFDTSGRLVQRAEYEESVTFLGEARRVAAAGPAEIRALLDTLSAVVDGRRPVADVRAVHSRLVLAMGPAGAIELPAGPLDLARGRSLYGANCAACHGELGRGDGPAGARMDPRPPAIADTALTPGLSAETMFNIVSVGIGGTPMPGFAGLLTAQERWEIVNYVHTLRGETMALPGMAIAAATRVRALLDSSLALLRAGEGAAAGEKALDAYLAFEPMEAAARLADPALVTSLERRFAEFRDAARRLDMPRARMARGSIDNELDRIERSPDAGWWGAFAQSLVIILREGFEAILIIGAVVTFLVRTGHRERLGAIWAGVVLALIASALMAVILAGMLGAVPASREIIEGVTMLVAVVVLFSVSYWLVSKVEAVRWQQFIKDQVNTALEKGGGTALAFVSFLAVFREGAETALFYQALVGQAPGALGALFLGGLAGAAGLVAIFFLFYRFGIRIPLRAFFAVTSVVLYALAFVFAGGGMRELQEGGVVSETVIGWIPYVEWAGIYPTLETTIPQFFLLALFLFAIVRSSGRRESSDVSRQTPRST